jgi:hypothetical protein
MGDAVWVQCARCGKLHKVKSKNASISDDDLYIKELHCPRCRDGTNHLWIGTYKDEVYVYGNANLDERFYNYNTK